jgi:tetratricopeptide (TPR) repeat protein
MNHGSALRRAPSIAGALLLVVLLLSGCATPQMASLERWPAGLPETAQISQVPFYPQDDYQCGPAALAMTAGAAGLRLTPEELVDQVYIPARKGSLQLEMLATGRRHGLLTYVIKPNMEALLREVAAGNPVIVLQNLSLPVAPVWHYAVVIGFDRASNTLTLHSGRTEKMEMSLFTFERTWSRGNHWAMLALPPTRLPATAAAEPYAASAAALERNAPRAAQAAYASALKVWPDHRTLWLGAGNSAYTLGQLDAALDAYRKLVALHPEFADAWNNLAQALLDQGQVREASAAISQAVSIGGGRLPRYLDLQKEIQAKL